MKSLAAWMPRPDHGSRVRSARILLAEDNGDFRGMLAAKLRACGYLVQEASTGYDVIEWLLGDQAFDLVLMDNRMPGVTGIEALEGLRYAGEPGRWAMPVILITAFGSPKLHAEAERLGAVVFDKPFDIDELCSCAASMVPPHEPM
jgi:CheY-like chemotaxis protein